MFAAHVQAKAALGVEPAVKTGSVRFSSNPAVFIALWETNSLLAGYSAQFVAATSIVAQLARSHSEGRLEERLAQFDKPKLLIIDELGYLPFEPNAAHLFFQLVSRRYEKGAILLTSNRSVGEWGAGTPRSSDGGRAECESARREPAVSKNLDRAVRRSAIILLLLWRHRPGLWCDFG